MMSKKTRILILAANPWDTKPLSLDEEYQRIQDLLESSPLEDEFEVHYYPALRSERLQQRVLKVNPHIIHFSGHGEESGLLFADPTGEKSHEVSKTALAQLLGLCKDLKAVFLNACYSANQAEEMVAQVPFLVGMNAAIDDRAAIFFSEGFYTAIFSPKNNLDIEQAYQAGLNRMKIEGISEKEQKKPVLKKRILPFVPSCESDVLVCFADADKQWKDEFIGYFEKKLKQGLYPEGSPVICSITDLKDIPSSAIVLLLTSDNFLQQHNSRLTDFQALAKNQPIYSIEITKYDTPDKLKIFLRHKFWDRDEWDNIISLEDDSYRDKADQVADLVVKKLRALRSQHESQQRVAQEIIIKKKESSSLPDIIFINSAPEDSELTDEIKLLLKQQGINCILLPIPSTDNPSPKAIRVDMKHKISKCDAVLVVCENTTPHWASKQVIDCMRLQGKRSKPFKVIALHRSERHHDLGIDWELMKTYVCPPQNIASYVPQFVEALK